MKKIMGMVFALALLPGIVFAGGGGQSRSAAEALKVYQRDPNLNPPGTFPINKQKVALKIGVQQNAMVENWETNWMTRQIEEKGNDDLSFEVYPAGEMNQKVELMVMAGGTDLPDVLISGGLDLASVTKWGQAGMVIPLNLYYANSAHYINEAQKDLAVDALKYTTSYDGNIYGMFKLLSWVNNEVSGGRILIYEPWLTKLGLAMPQSVDDLLKVLRAFRDQDPNGNGIKDEIPLVSYKSEMETNYFKGLMMPFIHSQNDFWMFNNGKIDVAFNKPGWRDGIRYTKQLIDEGLLSPLSFTQDQVQMTGLINPEPYKVGAFVRFSASNLGATDPRRTIYAVVPPLEGPAGKRWLRYPILPSIGMLITKNCKSPESAFMLGDFLASEEMSLSSHLGERGVDWRPAPPGTPEVAGRKPVGEYILQWGTLQNKHWAETGPFIVGQKNGILTMATNSPYDYMSTIYKVLPDQLKYAAKDPVLRFTYNEQEQEVINELHSTILSYVRESFARFATGDLNIDRDWDSYVTEFDNMGLTEVIAASQSAYDRMNK
jgi:putative aldouronate transport system substrate-binding protein